jgi:hypothetical protein
MSAHSYSRCWIHLIWSTLNREKMLVAAYIGGQEEHHRLRPFADELKEFVKRHGFCWRAEESR